MFDAMKTSMLVASLNNSEYIRNGNVSSLVPRHPDYEEEMCPDYPAIPITERELRVIGNI